MKIYSKITGELLHIVHRVAEFSEGRTDIVAPEQFLQVASLCLYGGQTFKAHKHIEVKKETTIAQESWVIIKGKIKAFFYDVDGSELADIDLCVGDCSITLKGGHNYQCLEPALVYEYKTGPYLSQELDKEFI